MTFSPQPYSQRFHPQKQHNNNKKKTRHPSTSHGKSPLKKSHLFNFLLPCEKDQNISWPGGVSYGDFLKWWVKPQQTHGVFLLKMIKHWGVKWGETHHLRKHPYGILVVEKLRKEKIMFVTNKKIFRNGLNMSMLKLVITAVVGKFPNTKES